MLKKLVLLTTFLLLAMLPAVAQNPCNTDLAAIFAPLEPAVAVGRGNQGDLELLFGPALEPAESVPPLTIALASAGGKPNALFKDMCWEDCDGLPDISCSGQVCTAVNRNCSPGHCERGSVTCDGITTWCSQPCPSQCTLSQCRQPCQQAGCVAVCIDTCNCECETICN